MIINSHYFGTPSISLRGIILLTDKVLKNIQIQELKGFLKDNEVKGRTTRITASGTHLKYLNYITVIEEEIASVEVGTLTSEVVDEFLFNYLFYANNNLHYVFRFTSYLHEISRSRKEITRIFSQMPLLMFNQNLVEWEDNTKRINLCTTRTDYFANDDLKTLHFLFRIANLELDYGKTSVFCGVTLDFEHDFLIFKFNQNQFNKMDNEPLAIINSIRGALSGAGDFSDSFDWMKISLQQLNEDTVNSTIYKLFKDLSLEAEDILNSKMTEENLIHIDNFMENVGLNNLEPKLKEEYIKQIKAVIYQDICRTMEESRFKTGWVFKLGFREGDFSRASQNAEKRSPVYSQQAFWQLKEIIHRTERMQEGGFHWKIGNSFVDVGMKSKNGALLVYYYARLRDGRREKEEYVLRKIAENF